MKLKVLNRLKKGHDIATEIESMEKELKGWVWINPIEENHPFAVLPPSEGKFLVSRFYVPVSTLERYDCIAHAKHREDYYFDSIKEALSKAEELAETLDFFDAPFNLPDFPL